jgi:hypothetical protein
VNSNTLQFTGGPNNRRSIWFNTPQDISAFEATFTYRASSIAASASRQGIAFVMQNAGTAALGTGSTGYQGVGTSAAVTLETDTGPGRSYSGFYTNGVIGGGSTVTTPVNAFDLRDIDVTVRYNGSILSVTMVDGNNTYGPQNYLVGNLASVLGGSTAYIGFTGATFNTLGSGGGATQFLSDVTFTTIPRRDCWVSAASPLSVGGAKSLSTHHRQRSPRPRFHRPGPFNARHVRNCAKFEPVPATSVPLGDNEEVALAYRDVMRECTASCFHSLHRQGHRAHRYVADYPEQFRRWCQTLLQHQRLLHARSRTRRHLAREGCGVARAQR